MSRLIQLEPADLAMLLALSPTDRIGAIIRLNRTPRYANTLNVVEILVQLAEQCMARISPQSLTMRRIPASSPSIPASSGSARTKHQARR